MAKHLDLTSQLHFWRAHLKHCERLQRSRAAAAASLSWVWPGQG